MNIAREILEKHLSKDLDIKLYLRTSPLTYQVVLDAINEAINYTRCCKELNPEFEIGEQVLLTKRTVVTIETFCEDGMIEVDDNNEYYKVDKDELSKRV